MVEGKEPFRWTERRVARLITFLVSAAVVAADVVLLFMFFQYGRDFPQPWKSIVPVAIFGIFLFAAGRASRHLSLLLKDQ